MAATAVATAAWTAATLSDAATLGTATATVAAMTAGESATVATTGAAGVAAAAAIAATATAGVAGAAAAGAAFVAASPRLFAAAEHSFETAAARAASHRDGGHHCQHQAFHGSKNPFFGAAWGCPAERFRPFERAARSPGL